MNHLKNILRGAAAALALGAGVSAMAAPVYPFNDPGLAPEERAADLCSRLTLEEKVGLMMNGSRPVERLGVPAFEWWSEGLHGVGRNGLATVFPSCIGMAAAFDDDLLTEVFTAVSDEARAKNTLARSEGKTGKYKGLSYWTPTVNIFRDPRWGRGQESYGEDPYMNGRMGLRVVRALQGDSVSKYNKLLACAKHFAVHSGPEKERHRMDVAMLPERDLWESYLPAFKRLVQEGNVREVMCAYQRFEGEACCGSSALLQRILREQWGFDGLVVSDCGAINDFYLPKRHGVAKDAEGASALGVRAGTDVECGQIYRNLPAAVRRGDISEEEIDRSVRRLLAERFRLGDFDPDSLVEWTRIPMSVVNSPKHKALALKAAREQMVLLKNNGILPLRKEEMGRVMLMGPNAADSTMQWGIYYGQPGHTVTVLEAMRRRFPEMNYSPSCDITSLTEKESIFNLFTDAEGRPGMRATYWNNLAMEGDTAATANYTSALTLDNGGNTVFAPGVELTNFTTRMRGSFTAPATEELDILFNNDDGFRIIVNGDTIHNRWKAEALNFRSQKLKVEKGKTYDIEINYMQLDEGATLNFDICRARSLTIPEIVDRAAGVETVIFVGGISPALEREQARVQLPGFDNGDRTSIELPQAQRDILRALHEAGKRVVLVNCSGSAVALTPEDGVCDAILQAWYPGEQGGEAVAEVLMGEYNPSGKLPVTFYADDSQLPPFDSYNMAGRTYRYLAAEPLYPFGYGLSYTTFSYGKPKYRDGVVTVEVKNTGKRAGTDIVQLYMRRPSDTDGPAKSLRGYARVELQPGEKRLVALPMPREAFENWDAAERRMRVVPGDYELMVGSSSASADLATLKVKIK